MKGSQQHAEKTAWGLVTIAHVGKEYVADHRALFLARRFSGKMGLLVVEDDIEEGTVDV